MRHPVRETSVPSVTRRRYLQLTAGAAFATVALRPESRAGAGRAETAPVNPDIPFHLGLASYTLARTSISTARWR